MNFELRTKHSLSNKFSIEEWTALNASEMAGFKLSNGNEIYFSAEEMQRKFTLNQKIKDVRKEIKEIIIKTMNAELKLEHAKIDNFILNTSNITGGYLLKHFGSEAYIKNIDQYFAEAFFERIGEQAQANNDLSHIACEVELKLGRCVFEQAATKIGQIIRFIPKFEGSIANKKIFNFSLGLKEIMIIKEESGMSIEDEIGEQVVTDDALRLDVDISLGKLEMSVMQMQDLLVGDFIDINHLSFPRVELNYKNKKIAIAELVYNENKELAIEIKQVLIK